MSSPWLWVGPGILSKSQSLELAILGIYLVLYSFATELAPKSQGKVLSTFPFPFLKGVSFHGHHCLRPMDSTVKLSLLIIYSPRTLESAGDKFFQDWLLLFNVVGSFLGQEIFRNVVWELHPGMEA